MEYWEFLIQKEGDQTWLPLETPEVEILEGKYRMVAKTNRPNENIEITISYTALETTDTQRPAQKRIQRTTNPEGLMILLPYTRLKPGLWEFLCSANKAQKTVKIEVLPVDEEVIPLTPQNPPPPPQNQPQPPTENQINHPISIELDRTTYIASAGLPVVVSGNIISNSQESLSETQLQIDLRNPQTAQILAQIQLNLAGGNPPIPFSCSLNIPPTSDSRLIIGEVKHYGTKGELTDSKTFTITAELGNLFDQIVQQLSEQQAISLSEYPTQEALGTLLDQSFETVLETIDKTQPIEFQTAPNTVLPPLLNKPNPSPQSAHPPKPLDLPSFTGPQPRRDKPNQAPQQPAPVEEPVLPPAPEIISEIVKEPETLISENPQQTPEANPQITPVPTPSPLDEAFQALNLPDKFFSRLNALASDEELSEILKTDLPAPTPPEIKSPEKPSAPKSALEWEAQEVVIEDEPTIPQKKPEPQPTPEQQALTLPPDEPVPMPVLEIPKAPLIAGRSVSITIRLPELQPRIYVKIWLQDRQARQILDGPYWVTEFVPSLWDGKEGTVQLIVPYGSLEVQFEAIAMEMQTQRESYKTSISRPVSPPTPPSLPNNLV